MKRLLFLSFVSLPAFAWGEVDGWMETRKYQWTNTPGHFDGTGHPMLYGVDFQLNMRLVPRYFTLMVGARSDGTKQGFSRAAGRLGFELHIHLPKGPRLDLGLEHESMHNFEYAQEATNSQRFFSSNWFYVRYNFGENPLGTQRRVR